MAKGKIEPRVRVPKRAKKGDIIEIKTLIKHPMESGERRRKDGSRIPRMIINKFEVTYNGVQVFLSDWHAAMSSNPFLTFHIVAQKSGMLNFKWTDDSGGVFTKSANIIIIE